ncbi:MAG: type VI secretion system baseplate subunit TssG [Gammaproteobacteria bacterium]|nr:type VI secretion system baseplate subunit TssG [Gammaproteobacteria bacterium]
MASENRPTSDAIALEAIAALEKELQEKPYKFGFYQALRRFECLNRNKPRIGESVRPVDDAVRLAQEPSLAFSPATLASFKTGKKGKPSELSVNFFGMFGPNGPLPLHLTEYARDRLRNSDDPTISEFLNIFHHRMLSLFYRSWANSQPTVNFDRPKEDRFSTYIGALFGLGMPSLRNRDEMPDLAKLHFAGRLSSQTRNAEGLAAMIKSYFNMPVVIEQFIGEWMALPDSCRCQLGISPETGTLGVNIAIGDYVWQCQQKFRIILGPLNFNDYERMLPGRGSSQRLRSMVRNYVGDSMNWDVNLVLKKEKVPHFNLGQNDLLGWNTWLGNRTSDDDVHDLLLEPMKTIV